MEVSFRLESFEGPLDLLLHLIEKNKVDIYDIPIALITDQYMDYISRMGRDADTMSEFLVMAATLLDIKARMLLPAKEEEGTDEEDPRAELVRQLLEYKLYKYMSMELKDKAVSASRSLYREPEIPEEVQNYIAPVDLDVFLGGVTLTRLKEVFDDVIKRSREKRNEEAIRFGRIKRDEISLPDKLEYIKKYTSQHKKFNFRTLIEKQVTRDNIIVTFLAILELMKSGMLVALQEEGSGEIIMYAPDSAPEFTESIEEDRRVLKKAQRIEKSIRQE
ncbi:MAG: segregation/condensation protein A [Parasporobacterium sp.]|nr:segregation/condensation protein A [Parasporobacterium sp.]